MPTDLVFDPFSAQFTADPQSIFKRLRNEAPVYHNPEQDFYALTRHADVSAAYRDHAKFSSARGYDLESIRSGEPPPNVILFMDPPQHGRLRALVNRAFTPRSISAQRATVVELVRYYLDRAVPEWCKSSQHCFRSK